MERDLTLQTASCFNLTDFTDYYARNLNGFRRIQAFEQSLVSGSQFVINAVCAVCEAPSVFDVDIRDGTAEANERVPNWRECLNCQRCGLNNRTRASLSLMKSRCSSSSSVYFTEHGTLTSIKGAEVFSNFACSDYIRAGALVFAEAARQTDGQNCDFHAKFDAIGCFDLLDRISHPKQVLSDLHARLRPGGRLFLTVPFFLNAATSFPRNTQTRMSCSEQDTSLIEGGKLRESSAFGWDLLQTIEEVGFVSGRVELYWSYVLANLGAPQMIITAVARHQCPV